MRLRVIEAATAAWIAELYRYDWNRQARDEQIPPDNDTWTTWLFLGGRGAGKTRAGAEWIRALVRGRAPKTPGRASKIALVAESYADAREVMIEGPSGLRAVTPHHSRPNFESSRRRLVWPNGATAYCFSAEDPDGLRGYQFDAAWSDELCKWRYPDATWSNLQLALRIGDRPRQAVTSTPRPTALIKRLMAAKTTVLSRATSYDNRDNLADAFFSEIAAVYEGTALGRQELLGELVDDVEGALWTWAQIEAARISVAPGLDRVVVAVDPPASIGPNADTCGIIIAGVATIGSAGVNGSGEQVGYVLGDWSVQGVSPGAWAERAVTAFHEFEADRIVVEVNQGGEMVRAVIEQIDASAPVRAVYATRSKRLRAEPVAALYERARVRHVGSFPQLEDQMTAFTGGAGKSPDRLDALVWALTELMLKSRPSRPGVRRLS